MKRSDSILVTGLKAVSALFIICSLCFLTAATKAKKIADDVWKQLGIALPDAKRNISSSFLYGQFRYSGAKNAKNIAVDNRVAVVNQLVADAKKYWVSQEFKTEYQNFRKRRKKPTEPISITVTAESIKADEKLRLERALKIAEEGLNSTNPKIKNSAPGRIEGIKKEFSALDDPDNSTIKKKLDEANRANENAVKHYKDLMQKFEAEYPEDPQPLLRKRLQEILNITADVDYAAELKEGYGGKKVFVNPVYQRKPDEWKLAFRAGKSATDAVRAAAQQWLEELK